MNIDYLNINTARFLSVDMIEKANSGHPGLPLGAAPMGYVLFNNHMKHNPRNPEWKNRDRFVLSAGHGSALLYSLLHIFGYDVKMDDLKRFRQSGSTAAGHPEHGHTKGVETSTGPLGQGIANAVGMAVAEKHLAANFNKDDIKLIDHFTYVLCGDGCLQEGVSSEACSFAGSMELSKLIILYDSNNITIEGDISVTFNEDVKKRFDAYGFQTLFVDDGNDLEKINKAIEAAKAETKKPTLIEIKTKIGYGSSQEGLSSAHGTPLKKDDIIKMKKKFEFSEEDFFIPEETNKWRDAFCNHAEKYEQEWNELLSKYKTQYPDCYNEWIMWNSNDFYDFTEDKLFLSYSEVKASRQSSEYALNLVAEKIPNLIGGSADLGPSNLSIMKKRESFTRDNPKGSNMHFGIREFAMSAIAAGMTVHGGLRVYTAGFFAFSDYMKSALRMQAIMGLPVISIFTHDSLGVGEDGPTHQPIEQLAALRSIPNFTVIRPCDSKETMAAWAMAVNNIDGPTALILSRQDLPVLKETSDKAFKGAYILKDCKGTPDIILMATGSEVSIIYDAYDLLLKEGIKARVVSMPSLEIFDKQSDDYKEEILPNSIRARLAVEAATSYGWHKYVGLDGDVISIEVFGNSAPAKILFEEFGFTAENVVKKAKSIIQSLQ